MSVFLFFHKMVLTKLNLLGFVTPEHREPESINNLQFTLAEFPCSNSLAFSGKNVDSLWESWLQNPMKFYQSLGGFKKAYNLFQQRNYHKIERTHYAPHGGNLWLRMQKQKLCDSNNTVLSLLHVRDAPSNNTVLSLLHVRDAPFYFWGSDWANAKKISCKAFAE